MKILIADKDSKFKKQLITVLRTLNNVTDINEFSGFEELLLFVKQQKAKDFLFIEKELVVSPRKEKITELLDLMSPTKIVLMSNSTKNILSFFTFGISGYICKKSPEALNTNVLCLILDGIPYLPAQILENLPDRYKPGRKELFQKKYKLTPRQIETLKHLGEGCSNHTIALRMNISESTVKLHINSLLTRLHAENRTKAVLIAQQLGFI